MNLIKYFFLLIILPSFLTSCKDVFEEDISEDSIVIVSPPNNLETNQSTITFWWNELDGARKYNLQIVSKTFSYVERLVLDTNVTTDRFQVYLEPGEYQWRIKGFNNGSETPYTTLSLKIDSTSDLSQEQVILISPTDNYSTNETNPVFSWYQLYNADDYRFEIRTPDWNGSLALNPEIVTGGNYTPTTLPEGTYEWGVQAQNSISNTPFSVRKITVDRTNPGTPTLLSPANQSLISNSAFSFSWNRITDSGTAIQDSLTVYSDSVLTTQVKSYFTSLTTQTDSLGTGKYYWRVRSIDQAGNKSNYSQVFSFTVQ